MDRDAEIERLRAENDKLRMRDVVIRRARDGVPVYSDSPAKLAALAAGDGDPITEIEIERMQKQLRYMNVQTERLRSVAATLVASRGSNMVCDS